MRRVVLTGLTVMVLVVAALPAVAVVTGGQLGFSETIYSSPGQEGDFSASGREYGFKKKKCAKIEDKEDRAEDKGNKKKENKLEKRLNQGNCDRFGFEDRVAG